MLPTAPIARIALLAIPCLLVACAGRIPDHDGYAGKSAKGWEKPTVIELDEDLEAEADGELSYPARRRARWFAVDLPEPGRLAVQLSYLPLGNQGDEEFVDDPFDVAFEVYDASHRLLVRADNEESDAGERKKQRTVEDLASGRYLVHVYLQRRLDEAEYNLRLQLKRGAIASSTDFPRDVRFPETLPQVPVVDDTPAPPPRPRCRGRRCGNDDRKPPRNNASGPKAEKDEEIASGTAMQGRITGVRVVEGGTRITINRGSTHGVAKGWKGRVVSKSGAGIANGSFTISQVKANESYATVNATGDAVTAAAYVRISP